MLIHPLQAEKLINIVSGKTGTNIVQGSAIRKAANDVF